ncbi:MAG: cation:proton antiporter [Desulfurococcales archaeon]|nr:cation:proton antiporter [Desulfurococcales archaeon]
MYRELGKYKSMLLTIGLAMSIASIAIVRFNSGSAEGDILLWLTAIAGVILASAFMAEALDVTPAILEIFLGYMIGLAGVRENTVLDMLALIGGVILMFMAGLEVDVQILKRVLIRSLVVGSISFTAPAVTTYVILSWLGYSFEDSMLAAIGVSTTSIAVVYAILRRTRLQRHRRGQLILASAMVADVLSIIAYSVFVFRPSGMLLVYVAALIATPWLASRLVSLLPRMSHEVEVRLVLALLLGITLLSEAVGIHGILFAFLLGIAFSELRDKDYIEGKISPVAFGFLAPLFFVNAGVHIAPVEISLLKIIAPLLLLASYPVKVASTHIALKLLGGMADPRLSSVFGARLTVSTIIAYAGLKSGILARELAAGIMLTALVATLISGAIGGRVVYEETM